MGEPGEIRVAFATAASVTAASASTASATARPAARSSRPGRTMGWR
jgi:hypothetical protein